MRLVKGQSDNMEEDIENFVTTSCSRQNELDILLGDSALLLLQEGVLIGKISL
ncbi:MAG: hypothetical protein QME45_12910 [Clostridiales bacterium]|nr:hypothetical protein [Clostridiales bacterium]